MSWTETLGVGRAMRPAAEAHDGRRGGADVDALISHLDSLRDRPPVDHNSRPLIRLAAGQLDTIADAAEAAIVASGLPVFRRGHELVRPVTREVAAASGRTVLAAGLRTVTPPALLDLYCRAARFEKCDGRRASWIAADPPDRIAAIHLSRAGYWAHPAIAGVVTTPTLRPDGSVALEAGYDPATRLFLLPDPDLQLPPIAERPTRGEAAASLELLQRLIDGFPFVSDVDRAGALAALLTPVCRGAFSNALCSQSAHPRQARGNLT